MARSTDGGKTAASQTSGRVTGGGSGTGPHYLTQTVYSMAGYRTLQNIISGYFAKHNWYCGEDPEDDLRIHPLFERWRGRPDQCYVSAIPVRSWYSLVGHGVDIRIINDKRQYQADRTLAIPAPIYNLFPGIPNRIEVDSHYRFVSDADLIACTLALKIADARARGTQTIRVDVDDEATRVKTNPLLEPKERFDRLLRRTEGYLFLNPGPSIVKKQLRQAVATAWPEISPEARTSLITGIFLYEQYDATDSYLLDSSPGIVALAAALELEVNRRLLNPFRQWLSRQGYTPSARGDLRPFALAAASGSSRVVELGRFGFYLRAIAEDRGSSAQPISQAFIAFCQTQLTDPMFVLDELPETLLIVAQRFRNPAAHTQLIRFSQFKEFVKFLLAGDGSGLLQRMFVATKPRI